MLKNNKLKTVAMLVLVCTMLSNCAAAPNRYDYEPYVPVDNVVAETPAVSEAPQDDVASESMSVIEDEPVPAAGSGLENYHRKTPEECRKDNMQMYLENCSTQATVETDHNACIVDVRTDENPYDVVWDYGSNYNLSVSMYDWSLVFDADYYMEQFPMLAYLYNYDEELLLKHFQTVGVHEGRQGSEKFNVADYMSKCQADVRELFGDCYAAYYFYWLGIETDHDMDVSGNGQPKQMTAVMTAMQKYELEQINELREELNLEPLVFDSEFAAFGNFRAYIDAAEDWEGHEWMRSHVEETRRIVGLAGSEYLSENTVKHYGFKSVNWFDRYYNSQSHYDAMVNSDYVYTGCSKAYLGDCEHSSREMVLVQFDVFTPALSTALNP